MNLNTSVRLQEDVAFQVWGNVATGELRGLLSSGNCFGRRFALCHDSHGVRCG